VREPVKNELGLTGAIMKLVKYCANEHNVVLGCNTLQLGTFDYYRELDPAFSIADASEGYIHYLGPEKEIVVGANDLNGVMGGVVQVTDRTTIGSPTLPKNPGATHVMMSGVTHEFGNDGVLRAKIGPSFEVKVHYPNCYIFCVSILGDNDVPNPSTVSEEYDSAYLIEESNFGGFVQLVAQALIQQLTVEDLQPDGEFAKATVTELSASFQIMTIHNEVKYFEQKEIRLQSATDFELNKYYEIYFESMFWKHQKFSSNREYRIVFCLRHPMLGFVSVRKQPKVLQLKPISAHVGLA
jgi:hypothetical protein